MPVSVKSALSFILTRVGATTGVLILAHEWYRRLAGDQFWNYWLNRIPKGTPELQFHNLCWGLNQESSLKSKSSGPSDEKGVGALDSE